MFAWLIYGAAGWGVLVHWVLAPIVVGLTLVSLGWLLVSSRKKNLTTGWVVVSLSLALLLGVIASYLGYTA